MRVFRTRVVLVVSLVVVFACPAFGATVLVVSDSKAPADAGGDHRDDPLVAELVGMGYTVDTTGMGQAFRGDFWTVPANVAAIAAADAIVVSRRTSSGSYNKKPQWNEIAKPMVLMSGYLSRDSRWGWHAGGSGNANKAETDMIIEAGQTGHAFFAGLTSPVTLFDWTGAPGTEAPKAVYMPQAGDVDEGDLLATFDGRGFMIDIPAGTNLGGSFGTTGDRRVFLPTWGYDGGSDEFGLYHTADFSTVFQNVMNEVAPTAAGEIPEPATLALASLALAGLGGYVRRRRKS